MKVIRRNKHSERDYEIINGKPHLGAFFGSSAIVNGDFFVDELEGDSLVSEVKEKLYKNMSYIKSKEDTFETRYVQWIIRPPIKYSTLRINGTIAVKFMIWGRAFKVKKLLKKGIKRYRKKWINGKRKISRIDKHPIKNQNSQTS